MNIAKHVTIVLMTGILAIDSFSTLASAKKKRVTKVSHIRVTATRVTGRTTKAAQVELLDTGNKNLGRAKASKKGIFVIKTKKNLKKVTFKFKVTKKGYLSRTFKRKVPANKKTTKSVQSNVTTATTPSVQVVPTPSVSSQSTYNFSLAKAQALVDALKKESNASHDIVKQAIGSYLAQLDVVNALEHQMVFGNIIVDDAFRDNLTKQEALEASLKQAASDRAAESETIDNSLTAAQTALKTLRVQGVQ